MRFPQFPTLRAMIIITALVTGLSATAAFAKDPPSDLCSLLTPTQIEKTLKHPFDAAEKSTAPSPFRGLPSGSHCEYPVQKGEEVKVVLIAYVDPSESVAKDTFDKLAMWYSPESKPAIGDSAYMDSKGAIHVLKGKVRYYVAIEAKETSKAAPYLPWATGPHTNSPTRDQMLKDLATTVASEL